MKLLVKDLFPIVNGVFKYIDYTFWDFTSDELDIQLVSRCGSRRVAPIIRYIRASPSNNKLNEIELSEIADLILKTYKYKWDRLSGLPLLEYDILKNYLDQYEEVLKDDDSTAESRLSNKATRNLETSKLAVSTGSNAIQNASNNSETESTRVDNFSSDFTRSSSDNTTRTDNLAENKTETEDSESTRTDNLTENQTITDDVEKVRTDNLTDSKSGTNSETVTHQGGTYAESTTRQLTNSGSQSIANGVYGFNSSTSVGDSDSSNTTSGSENETVNKSYSGSKSDSSSATISEDVAHTGTQTIEEDRSSTVLKTNTGTQRDVSDIDKTSNKTNTGTQSIDESISVTDSTVNTDDQVNTTTSEGTSNTTNSTTQKSVSSSEVNSGNASKLDESSVISRALNRARMYTHKGNIGNFTPQQLIKQEIELWRWNFIDEILNDVKDFISIPIY